MKRSVKTTTRATRNPDRPSPDGDPRFRAMRDALAADPRLAPAIAAFEANQKECERGPKFGSNGLKVDGRLFALFTQGTLVVKLPKDRVATLSAAGMGEPFDPGHGRRMKEWLTVVSAGASWAELAREAHDFVEKSGGSPKRR